MSDGVSDGVVRIGRPPSGPAPAQAEPPPPPRRWLLIAALAGVFVGLGVAGVIFVPRLLDQPQAAPPVVPMPAPSTPNHKVLDVQGTCVLLVPVAQDGANAVLALVSKPDGSTMDWPKLDKTINDLKLVQEVAAPELRDDIGQQIATLSGIAAIGKTGGKLSVGLEEFRSSGLRIGARCRPYAS